MNTSRLPTGLMKFKALLQAFRGQTLIFLMLAVISKTILTSILLKNIRYKAPVAFQVRVSLLIYVIICSQRNVLCESYRCQTKFFSAWNLAPAQLTLSFCSFGQSMFCSKNITVRHWMFLEMKDFDFAPISPESKQFVQKIYACGCGCIPSSYGTKYEFKF